MTLVTPNASAEESRKQKEVYMKTERDLHLSHVTLTVLPSSSYSKL